MRQWIYHRKISGKPFEMGLSSLHHWFSNVWKHTCTHFYIRMMCGCCKVKFIQSIHRIVIRWTKKAGKLKKGGKTVKRRENWKKGGNFEFSNFDFIFCKNNFYKNSQPQICYYLSFILNIKSEAGCSYKILIFIRTTFIRTASLRFGCSYKILTIWWGVIFL